jgi:hypothetical protein
MRDDKTAIVHPLDEFLTELNRSVSLRCSAKASQQELEQGFTEWALEQLSPANEADNADLVGDTAYVAESRGQWPGAKLNAWALSGDGATLDLFVSYFERSGKVERLGLPETRRLYRLALGFLRRALDGFHEKFPDQTNPAQNISQAVHENRDNLTTVRLILLTNKVANAEDIEQERIEGLDLRYVLWDLQKFSQLQIGHREVVTIDFAEEAGGPIPCLKQPHTSAEFTTFLAFIPGPVLARLYGAHGQRLLERNVRAFLQNKGKVNRSIQETLRETPARFLSYNNGLCCTAAEIRLGACGDGSTGLAWAKDFQIVNGGQTTASVYHAWKKERLAIDDVVVQVKLTVVQEQQQVNELVPLIARYANSQNKVSTADLAANGSFHQQLEQLSRTIWAPATDGLSKGVHWYYERARGSYLDDKARQGTPSRRREWELENPAKKKFTKTDLAKYENAWNGSPHWVCMGAEKNFVKFAERIDDQSIQVDASFFQQAVARAILWRAAEKHFDNSDLEGYRANTVAYTVSWLAEKCSRRIDLDRIWKEQWPSPVIGECIKTVCREAWNFLTSQAGNIGEVSKREETWQKFSRMNIPLPQGWERELADRQFLSVSSVEDGLANRWEAVRLKFLADPRTFEQLEAWTGKKWMRARREQTVQSIVTMPWAKLNSQERLGLKRIKSLIELLEAAKVA